MPDRGRRGGALPAAASAWAMAGPHQSSPAGIEQQPRRPGWRRWLPIGVIALGLILVFAFDIDDLASFEHLRAHHQRLVEFVASHYLQAVVGFVVLYVLFVALSLPGAIWLTVAGGFLFGTVMASVLAVIAATTGASLLFLATKTSL